MTALMLSGLLLLTAPGAEAEPGELSVTPARECASLRPFDDEMIAFMRARHIPGGALAVSRHGKLVLATGYGWADREAGRRVAPGSLFRIASISKPFTAVAVLQLVERGVRGLTLDTPIFEVLHYEPHLDPGAQVDPRLARITVRQVLQHTAGWDRDVSFDPMFQTPKMAREMGAAPPAGPGTIIPYMLGRPLDHDPGSTYAYSNFGYCVLGRLIEKLSGLPYEAYIRERVLAPLGIRRMRLGHTLPESAAPDEVRYYDSRRDRSVMAPEAGAEAPAPYGTFYLEAMDAHGGWIASAAELVRFACAFDDPQRCPLLRPETIPRMFARPEGSAGYEPDGQPKAAYYACGWMVRPTGDGKANHWHGGGLPGTSTLLVRRHDGLNWAALFNQNTDEPGLSYGDIDPALHRAADRVASWPEDDLFPQEGIR